MEEMKIPQLLKHLKYAATWNHGVPGRIGDKRLWRPDSCRETFEWYNQILLEVVEQPKLLPSNLVETLLSPEVVGQAFKALSKSDYMPPAMSIKVRSLERFLGRMGQTQLTDELSLRLLAANSRAGNVGRSLQLLELRGSRSFPPRNREFVYAIQAIESANFQNKTSRNYFVGEAEQIPTDNPTRWLDAVLIQMASRNYALTTAMANRMLHTVSFQYFSCHLIISFAFAMLKFLVSCQVCCWKDWKTGSSLLQSGSATNKLVTPRRTTQVHG